MIGTIESYNLKDQKWEVEGELQNFRLTPLIIALDTRLYILAGLSSNYRHTRGSTLDTVEVFDTKKKQSFLLEYKFPF